MDKIIIKGARENNLKNIDIELPKNKFIVMTGLSGSGKSSLAFDTIYQEGQRRFVESLSSYARQFLGGNEKPDVDSIEGLSPAIAIDQKSTNKNPRSTVGTVTEIYDFLRVLYARIGVPYCPNHNIPISATSQEEIVNRIVNLEKGSKIYIMSPVIQRSKGEHKAVLEKFLKEGFIRARIDGEILELDSDIVLDKNKKHNIDLIVERLVIKDDIRARVSDAVRLACKYSEGLVKVIVNDNEELFFSENYACVHCGYTVGNLEPRLFSFNSPLGACSECNGLGVKLEVSAKLVLDLDKSINGGGILPYKNQEKENLTNMELQQTCKFYNIDMETPIKNLTEEQVNIILYGSKDMISFKLQSSSGRIHDKKDYFEGVITNFERRYLETTSEWIRDWIEGYMTESVCSCCHGKRLNEQVLNVFIDNKNISDLCELSIEDLYSTLINLSLNNEDKIIAKQALKEITDRLKFLINVGLEYLKLSRSAVTLSGGEAQRIRLATQIGSRLTGVLYVLDEPSIGLHQKDNEKLIGALKEMRDLGNTLIVVEHDDETMLACDYLVDIGPKAGSLGGSVVAAGTVDEVMKCKESITAQYLTGKLKIELPENRSTGNGKYLEV
ncbi:MAG: excinuclease ABC subunit UvrA, partial [Anaeroplasmataceae bacterium]